MSDEPVTIDRLLCFALYNASRAMIRAYGPLLEPLGLTYPQYIVLVSLWEHDGVAVSDLGGCLGLDSGTLTPLLKRLEQRGLVQRRRDKADERVVRISLTPEGRALRGKSRTISAELAAKAGFDLTKPRDVTALQRLRDELTALTARLAG